MKRRIIAHTGTRGLALALLGLLWILMGLDILIAPLKRTALIDEQLPVAVRAALWIGPGVLALAACVWRKLDPDAWGWLMVPVMVRFVSFLFGWLCALTGWWQQFAYPDGWRGVKSIAVFVTFVMLCAKGLDRPAPTTLQRRD